MYYQFAAFSFDPQRGLEGPAGRIGLRRCDADLLCMLLEADGRTVTKEAILSHVWRGRLVTEHSISQAVRRLRKAFGRDGESVIQTVYGSGFRLGVAALRQETVADAPRPAFAASPSLAATTSLAAAWELAARRSPRELAAAIEAAQFALERDPGFVAAWCGLATFHAARAARMVVPPRDAGAAAVNAANRALQLDATCAPALALRGWVRACIELDVAAGLEDLARSLDITGNYWLSRGLYGWALMAAGRPAAAAAELRTACGLNPWSNWFSGVVALYLHFAGDNEAGDSPTWRSRTCNSRWSRRGWHSMRKPSRPVGAQWRSRRIRRSCTVRWPGPWLRRDDDGTRSSSSVSSKQSRFPPQGSGSPARMWLLGTHDGPSIASPKHARSAHRSSHTHSSIRGSRRYVASRRLSD